MTDIKGYINTYVSSEETLEAQGEAFDRVAAYVAENSMHDLIELLEDKLVSVEDRVRNRATTLLSELFSTMNLELQGAVLHLFTVFFSHRLSDYPSVVPSLQALTALASKYGPKFEPKYVDALDMFQSVFRSLQVPAYAQTVRYKVYILFKTLLGDASFSSSLQPNGVEILDGIISSMEEEKDPRCLLEVFRVVHAALTLFHAHLTKQVLVSDDSNGNDSDKEDGRSSAKLNADSVRTVRLSVRAFEALNCYFPITFRPPPNDPFGITSEMLITTLEDCLCSAHSAHTSDGTTDSNDVNVGDLQWKLPLEAAADPNAIVRLSVPFFVRQLSATENEDMPIACVHALRALVRIVRTNPASYGVFGLLPQDSQGDIDHRQSALGEKSPSPGGGNVSAEDRALMDMVDDADGYADMYIQDADLLKANSSGAALDTLDTPWTPAPQKAHLLRTLSTLSERLYALLTDAAHLSGDHNSEEEDESHTTELRVHGLTLVGAITAAMVASGGESAVGVHSVEWGAFQGALLERVHSQLTTDVSAAATRAAMDIAYVMARTGGDAGCEAVLQCLAPFLLQATAAAHTQVQGTLHRAARDVQDGTVTNLTQTRGQADRAAAAVEEEGKLAAPVEMLAQLLACVGEYGVLASDTAGRKCGGGGRCGGKKCGSQGKGQDHSGNTESQSAPHHHHHHGHGCGHHHHHHHDHEESHASKHRRSASTAALLDPYLTAVFTALAQYPAPFQLSLAATAAPTAAANPFAAVKAAFAGENATVSVSEGAENTPKVAAQFLAPAAVVQAIVASMSAMRELLLRVDCAQLPEDQLCAYVRHVTALGIRGMPALVSPVPETEAERILPLLQAEDTRECAEVLYRATVSLLVTFCDGDNAYQEVIRAHSLRMLAEATTVSLDAPNGAKDKRVFGLVGAVATACPFSDQTQTGTMFADLVALLQSTVERCLSADTTAGGNSVAAMARAQIALQALVDLLGPSGASNPAVGSKARFLALGNPSHSSTETDESNAPIAAFVETCLRSIRGLLSSTGDAQEGVNSLVDTLHTLLRQTVVALPDTEDRTVFVVHTARKILQDTQGTSGHGSALAAGLLCSLLVWLDKGSEVFAGFDAHGGLLRRCGDLAILAVEQSLLGEDTAIVTADEQFGAAQLLALLMNKVHNAGDVQVLLQRCLRLCLSPVAAATAPLAPPALDLCAGVLLWITRAVAMRKTLPFTLAVESLGLIWAAPPAGVLFNTWQEFLGQFLVDFLTQDRAETTPNLRPLQVSVASKMHLLTADDAVVLSPDPHRSACEAALFWKQKLWSRLFPQLAPVSTTAAQLPTLSILAVCSLLRGVGQAILQDALPRVVEIVVTGLGIELETPSCPVPAQDSKHQLHSALSVQVLAALQQLLAVDAQLFTPYLNVVLPAVLKTATEASLARVRAAALESLLVITEQVPYMRLYPFKAQVGRQLQRALDDRKKAVRVLAGRVRNKWLIMK